MDPKFEAVQSDVGSCLRCLYFTCASFSADHTWHYHPEFELTWVIRSSGTRFVGDSVERYGAGDLVMVGPNLPHCWHNDDGGESPELIVIQFDRTFLGEDFLKLSEARPILEMLEQAKCGLQFGGDCVRRAGELLRALVVQQGMERLIRFLEVLTLLASASERVRLAQPEYHLNNDINPLNRKRISVIHEYVHANLGGEICQAEIARRLGLSPPAFSRFFRAATGKTFVCFVNLLRVNQACRLLAATKLSITAVAIECGYDNISNFNRQFLALKGMNPTEYRIRSRALGPTEAAPPRLQAVS